MAGYRRALVRQSQRDAARYVLDDMVEDILDRLEFMRFEPARVLVIGDWTGTLALSLRGRGSQVEEANVRTIDEEKPIGDGSYDLIVSLASLGRVNDLPGALLHLRTALAEGGIVIASLIGAMIIQAVNTGILLSGFPPEFNLVIKAAIILIILVVQSPAIRANMAFFRKAPSSDVAKKETVTQ